MIYPSTRPFCPMASRMMPARPDSTEQYNSLIAAGINPSVAADIKQRSDQWELARLDLIDTAVREGWRRSDQFEERIDELRDERVNLRSELGDDQYDRYLFESGGFNRVRIDSIIDGSAANLAGMQTGDFILSYAGQRVFQLQQLQRATRDGIRGENIQIQLRRAGQFLTVDLPRGPLGVTLAGAREEPFG